MEISADQALGFRTDRQHLQGRLAGPWVRVVSSLLGVQSQVMSAGQMQIAVRAARVSRSAIEDALWKRHRLFKTNLPRGTLHLQTPETLSLLVSAHSDEGPERWENGMIAFGMKPDHAKAVTPAVVEALRDGPLTRKQLAKRVASLVAPELEEPLMSGWSWALRPALGGGLVCFGPKLKQETTFMLTDGLLDPSPLEHQAAKRKLLLQYFEAYGPAGVDDFSLWLGLLPKIGRQWMKFIEEHLTRVTVEGRKQFILSKDLDELRESSAKGVVRMLPFFDVYLLARTDKDLLIERDLRSQVYRAAGWVAPTVLVNGRIAGTWRQELKPSRFSVEVNLFRQLSIGQKRLIAQEAEQIGTFLGAQKVDLKVGFSAEANI